MRHVRALVAGINDRSIADYFRIYRNLRRNIGNEQLLCDKNIRISILASFTINGIKEILTVECCELGISPEFYIGSYNQYFQEILNPDSALYRFTPDVIIVFIDIMTIWGEQYFLPYLISEKDRMGWVDEKANEIQLLIKGMKEHSAAKILLHNFAVPLHSPLGILENKQEFGFIEATEELNNYLRDSFKLDSRVFIFDYNSFCSGIGKQNIMDHKMYYLGDMKLDLKHMPSLAREYLSYIKPILSLTKKCIVLDLDNTLWGGVVGEDGFEGIKLGPTPEGRPFLELQRYLLSLFHRGVILAINSKNNFDDAIKVIKEHPDMILKEQHFATMQINWNDKISNMKAISAALNIGMESLVFIDDDKLNREMVKGALPEVLVVDLPDDTSCYLKTLMEIDSFNTLHLTDEDRKKGEMYAAQKRRHEVMKVSTDITEYLKKLEIVVKIEKANPFTIPRISQLTQKTNQFNMTTKRYLDEDIKQFTISNNFLVISIKVEDRFGDNGITGVVIVEKECEKWRIDTFLLSCRVLGRKVDEVLLAYIIEQARKGDAKTLIGVFVHTKKNIPAKEFYKNNGFALIKKEEEMEIWEYDLRNDYPFLGYIRVIEKE